MYVENLLIGQLTLQSTVRYARKSISTVKAPLKASLADGALINLVRLAGKNEVEVLLKGKVKAGVWFISKKIPVENKQTIDGELLRFGLP